ncbi:MAG: hypothetical protein Q4C47_01870, partial [Planctomycetia bacterium]|nr:hypothetical protein [Planctomycetia bacterium]
MHQYRNCLMLFSVLYLALIPRSGMKAEEDPAELARRPAQFIVTKEVLRPAEKVPPLGVNGWGGCGAIEYAANNLVQNPGNEPIYWKNLHRIMKVDGNRLEIDGPGTSWWDLWGNGFLSGATVRIYRLVDQDGKELPEGENGEPVPGDDPARIRVKQVDKTTIVASGEEPELPDGGWVATKYAEVNRIAHLPPETRRCVDELMITNGRKYWYVVTAVSADGTESGFSTEVSATPRSGLPTATDADRTEDTEDTENPETERK